MSEKGEQLTRENEVMKNSVLDSDILAVEAIERPSTDETQKLQVAKGKEFSQVLDTPLPLPPPTKVNTNKGPGKKQQPAKFDKRDAANARILQEHCRQLCLSLFFGKHAQVRSLGFTSSIEGEGKSFLALVTAQVLAHDSSAPVTLLECNLEHPSLHEYFDIPATPGLAEWLRGTCDEDDIRYRIDDNLTVIPAGNGSQDAIKLLKQLQQNGLHKTFAHQNQLLIVDLPPIITTTYGSLAAGLLESIVVVVRAQVVPNSMVIETCKRLKDLPVHGIILNQGESRIPRWIRQLL
jgi:Mrp family chromosome partitioning ATPase